MYMAVDGSSKVRSQTEVKRKDDAGVLNEGLPQYGTFSAALVYYNP